MAHRRAMERSMAGSGAGLKGLTGGADRYPYGNYYGRPRDEVRVGGGAYHDSHSEETKQRIKDNVEKYKREQEERRRAVALKGEGIFDTIKEYGSRFLKWLSGPQTTPPPPQTDTPPKSAPPRSAPPPPKAAPSKPAPPRTPTLAELGITDRKSMLKWIGKNHPDKGGDAEVFKRVMAQAQNAGIKVGQGKLRAGMKPAGERVKIVLAPPRPANPVPPPRPRPAPAPEAPQVSGQKRKKAGEGKMRGCGRWTEEQLAKAEALAKELEEMDKEMFMNDNLSKQKIKETVAGWNREAVAIFPRAKALMDSLRKDAMEMPPADHGLIYQRMLDAMRSIVKKITGEDLLDYPDIEEVNAEFAKNPVMAKLPKKDGKGRMRGGYLTPTDLEEGEEVDVANGEYNGFHYRIIKTVRDGRYNLLIYTGRTENDVMDRVERHQSDSVMVVYIPSRINESIANAVETAKDIIDA